MSSSPNGPVVLGRDMRIRLDRKHAGTLKALAQRHGWKSETAYAEVLLAQAIEMAATGEVRMRVLRSVHQAFWAARIAHA